MMETLFLSQEIRYLSRVAQFFFHRKKLTVWFFIIAVVFFWKPVLVLSQETIVTPTVTIAEQYESNPGFVVGGEDDWAASTVVSPEIAFSRNFGHQTALTGTVGADLAYYSGNSEFNNEAYAASLGLSVTHSPKTTFTITESFSYSEDSLIFDPDSESVTDTSGILVERSDILSNRLAFSVRHTKSEAVTLGLTLSDNRAEYDLSTLSDTRSISITPIVEIMKAINPKTDFSSSYDFTRFYLESAGVDETIDTHSLLVGIDHRVTADFSISGSVGAVYTSESGFNFGFIGDLGLSKSTPKSEISLIYSRRANVTPFSNDLTIRQGLSASITSSFMKDVTAAINAGAHSSKSETSSAVDVASYDAGVDATWHAYSWMSISAGYSYYEQESDGTVGDDLSRNTVFVNIMFVPAVWRF